MVEVAVPPGERAGELPGYVADVGGGGDGGELALVGGMGADGSEESVHGLGGFLGGGARDEVEEAGLVVVRGVEGGFPAFDGLLCYGEDRLVVWMGEGGEEAIQGSVRCTMGLRILRARSC